jgi:nitrite reductase/ring-hydroxylating ferredoxin subunit
MIVLLAVTLYAATSCHRSVHSCFRQLRFHHAVDHSVDRATGAARSTLPGAALQPPPFRRVDLLRRAPARLLYDRMVRGPTRTRCSICWPAGASGRAITLALAAARVGLRSGHRFLFQTKARVSWRRPAANASRSSAAQIAALSNLCAHQNGPIGEGRIIDGYVTCPWHGYQYRLDDGCAPPPFTEKLVTYRVRVAHSVIEVDPRPLPVGTPAAIRYE